jgi:hypothetical protein
MKFTWPVLLIMISLAWLAAAPLARSAGDSAAAEAAAVQAAEQWLALVDAAEYDRSWTSAAAYFKAAITGDKWNQTLAAFRGPLGRVLSRERAEAAYATTLPGAPDGEYVVVQFKTSFENKKSAVETVTPMLENDGRWRVSGYYIK